MNNNRDSLKNILRREGLSRDNSPILHVKRNGKLDVLKRYATLQIIEKSMPEETYSFYFPYVRTFVEEVFIGKLTKASEYNQTLENFKLENYSQEVLALNGDSNSPKEEVAYLENKLYSAILYVNRNKKTGNINLQIQINYKKSGLIEQEELEKAINKVSSLITGKYFIATKLGKGEKKTYLVVNRMVKKLGVLGQQIGFKFEKYEIVTNKKKRKKNK